jgi:PPK2 family polyphosphate:nucleotide phosphotransferase
LPDHLDTLSLRYQFPSGKAEAFDLAGYDSSETFGLDKLMALERTVGNTLDLRPLQERLFAEGRQAVLVIFQAMDAAGKDSAINHVFSGINPQGCQVHSFKHPTTKELNHDYLWRCSQALPEKGMIGVFNRSYYEEVLVAKVHPELVLHQKLPNVHSVQDVNEQFWEQRYQQIRSYERRLTMNGITIIKFFLHLSKKEQTKRFLKRVKRPDKNWKFSSSDMKERAYWDDYQQAYQDCIQATSSEQAPWYIIPADHKWFARAAISQVLVDRIAQLNPSFPELDKDALSALEEVKKVLKREEKALRNREA